VTPVYYTTRITSLAYSRDGLTLVFRCERQDGFVSSIAAFVLTSENLFAAPTAELRYSPARDTPSAHLAAPTWDWLRQLALTEYERLRTFEHLEVVDADELRGPSRGP
jgi:hypothetical protein